MQVVISAQYLCPTCRSAMNFVKTDLPRQIKCSSRICSEKDKVYWEPMLEARPV
jgi:hypothetical protein